MKKILLFFISLALTIPVFAQRSTFSVHPDGYYLLRQKPNESAKKFFGIGVYSTLWPQSTSTTCIRRPSEKEFTSAREIFNIISIRYNTENWGGCGEAVPSWLTTANSEAVLMTGPAEVNYRLKTGPGLNENGGVLGPVDQDLMASRLADEVLINNIVNGLLEFTRKSGRGTSDLIFGIQDEPERGLGNWHFTRETISAFKYSSIVSDSNLITYVDLGPVTGNNYLFEKYFDENEFELGPCSYDPPNTLSNYGCFIHSLSSEEAMLKETVSYYKNTADILGVNSYSTTSLSPYRLGQYVKWIHQETRTKLSNKPVLPWISAECFRYGSTQCTGPSIEQNYYRNIRSQAFSAIINKATGVLFYPDRSVTHERWDEALDIAKELHYYKYILENGSDIGSGSSSSSELINKRIGDYIFTFWNQYDPDIASKVAYYTIQEMIWHNLSFPKNLGFEKPLSTSGYFGNWQVTATIYPDVYSQINSNLDYVKIGSQSIHIYDDSDTYRTAITQEFDIIPGFEYQAQGWYYGVSGWQKMIMLFYGPSGYIGEHEVKNHYSTNGSWALLQTTPIKAPAGATKIKLYIGTSHKNWDSVTSEGYWDDVMVKIVGDGGSSASSKMMVQDNPLIKQNYDFDLNQNYPNPFNPNTTISYSIQQQGNVTLSVFNLAGQRVATLVDKQQSPGYYEVDFDARSLSSGIYFYELRSENQVLRKKMTLIK